MPEQKHKIEMEPQPDGMVTARCKCGWHATSADEGLAIWNADGHWNDVYAETETGPLPDYLEERAYREHMEDMHPLATFPWEI